MGSRWCPEEIELFYNGKFLPAKENFVCSYFKFVQASANTVVSGT